MEKQPNDSLGISGPSASIVPSREKIEAVLARSKEVLKEKGGEAVVLGKDATREATKIGQKVAKSDLGKAAIAGAAVGAVAAIPVPLVGPPLGAVLGAAAGMCLQLKYGTRSTPERARPSKQPEPVPVETAADILASLKDLENLRRDKVITDAEFEAQKAKLLNRL